MVDSPENTHPQTEPFEASGVISTGTGQSKGAIPAMSKSKGCSKMKVRGRIVRDNGYGLFIVKDVDADRHYAVTADKWMDAATPRNGFLHELGETVVVTVQNDRVVGARKD